MNPSTCVSIFLIVVLLSTCCFSQNQTVIGPSKDNTLFEDTTGSVSNGAGPNFYVGKNNQGFLRRGVLAFDVAGSIPAGVIIDSVTLTLFMSQTTSGAQMIELHRVASDWGEGSSNSSGGQGAPATPGDATWLHTFFDSAFWGMIGGDFTSAASSSVVVDSVGFYTWESTPAMVLNAQQWLDDPSINFGWLVLGEEIINQSTKRFESRENGTPANRPSLTVFWSDPSSTGPSPASPPTQFQLSQNYPNPFNPETTIQYVLAQSRFVRLNVYDLPGQRIATLVSEFQSAGVKRVVWNGKTETGTSVPAGVYIYEIEAGDFVRSGRMIHLK